ncbi:alpha/beta fold hydrolase [Nocardioides sp.]|uniref:lipase family alpha/beta hydrolase n=1 Tax=Nocardioides sp. TaxID=35761 RepID=UPI002626FE1D|nr:alpha/beta fold hydrolase [Nocardioides sp.]MCW2737277.1 Lipase [Nocardioides sp.]
MVPRVLASLSPARRRLALAIAVLLVIAVATATGVALLRRDPAVRPVAQDRVGPVLLVPGYGGSTTSLEVLGDVLEAEGRDVRIVAASGSGTGDLREAASHLAEVVDATLAETGAPSVDVVGYSAGGVVLRLYVADLGGGSTVRRAVTLSSPHHGTDLAALALALGTRTCPVACEQLDPDSDLLRRLNAGDETPAGPEWVVLWTEDDGTVVPPESGDLEGALGYAVQSVCSGLTVEHPDVPRTPAVIAMVESALGTGEPVVPDASVCTG